MHPKSINKLTLIAVPSFESHMPLGERSRQTFSWFFRMAILCLITFCLPAPAVAQVSGGSITGTITDPTSAVIPGATVKIVNRGTGVGQMLKTTSTGLFNKPNLDPGIYDVTIEANDFSSVETDALVDG